MPTITGTLDDDRIEDFKGASTIRGRAGDDLIFAYGQNDLVLAGGGDDTVFAGNGNDEVRGRNGDDIIFGGNGDDRLFGGNGDDTLFAGDGADILRGGNGNDILLSVGEGYFPYLNTSYLSIFQGFDPNIGIAIGSTDADYGFTVCIDDLGLGEGISVTEGRITATGSELDFPSYEAKRISAADILIGGAGEDVFDVGAEITAILDFDPGDDLIIAGGFEVQEQVENDGASVVGFLNDDGQVLLVASSDASASDIVTAVTDQALIA